MRYALLFLTMTCLLAISGCTQPSAPPQATLPPAFSGEAPAWRVENSTRLGSLEGIGTFFLTQFYPLDGCHEFDFQVPSNATYLRIVLEGSQLNMSEYRAGQYGVVVTPPGDNGDIGRTPIVDQNLTVEVEDPLPGMWNVRIVAQPVAVNQYWPVYVTLVGNLTGPTSLPLHLKGPCPGGTP